MDVKYVLVKIFLLPKSLRCLIGHRYRAAAEKLWVAQELKQDDRLVEHDTLGSGEDPLPVRSQ
ncbi:MFS transporter [Penicillium sp. IBT 16267x]|nr:MFS transporter [Penicillium sp. IBT 16267x]